MGPKFIGNMLWAANTYKIFPPNYQIFGTSFAAAISNEYVFLMQIWRRDICAAREVVPAQLCAFVYCVS